MGFGVNELRPAAAAGSATEPGAKEMASVPAATINGKRNCFVLRRKARRSSPVTLQSWFDNVKNAESAKAEILALFSEEPGDGYTWSEQDIWE